MAVADSSAVENNNSEREEEIDLNSSTLSPKKRTKDPGVRVRNGRIYDSEHGKTCHQCRQKTRDFAAFCKNLKKDKTCTLVFCHKCLLNRYGEKADEVGNLENWVCPKCRGVCNCSFCMKRKGYQPTGILAHTAKATGYNSVHELVHNKGSEVLEPRNADSIASPKKSPLSDKGSPALKRSRDKENQCVEQKESRANDEGSMKGKRAKRLKCSGTELNEVHATADGGMAEGRPQKSRKLTKGNTTDKGIEKGLASADQNHGTAGTKRFESPCKKKKNCNENGGIDAGQGKENASNAEAKPLRKVGKSKNLSKASSASNSDAIVLPQGKPLTEVAGFELSSEDVGAALQFLEFCNAFSEVLDIKRGQPEGVLRNLTRGRAKRHGVNSTPVEFNIKLLSLLYKDTMKDGDEWMQTLKTCIEESECSLGELPLDLFDRGSSGYDNLEPSKKLEILNFLCDEVLVTFELRNWIDEAAEQFDEKRKANKEIVIAAKKKEKLLKQKAKDETAKAMLTAKGGNPLSLTEFDNLLSQLRAEANKVHAEVVASIELVPKKNQRSDAVRTDHVVLGSKGQVFWKLSGYNNRSNIILQDIGSWDSITHQDKWFIFNEEEDKVVEKYISSLRNQTPAGHKLDDVEEEEAKSDSSESPDPEPCLPQEVTGA